MVSPAIGTMSFSLIGRFLAPNFFLVPVSYSINICSQLVIMVLKTRRVDRDGKTKGVVLMGIPKGDLLGSIKSVMAKKWLLHIRTSVIENSHWSSGTILVGVPSS